MDPGFQAFDGEAPIDIPAGAKVFLIRLPKDVDVGALNGRKLKVAEDSNTLDSFNIGSKSFNIVYEKSTKVCSDTMRPIVNEEITGGISLGPKFAGYISVEQNFQSFAKESESEVPVSFYFH
jgi:hypothetical protein